ncbi:hypothetical protein E2562_020203 [Oryza meyeriana var. granulata]|uniref:NB-ARC domain-containing protein n=1 Tax=Oryza meyeriana var. granulata TaxID=110450 RepID=A0A6G1BMM9_9ORYZ|nr:hypothetical protein E2562_020203 [Oryza meyeriana var. granulata]
MAMILSALVSACASKLAGLIADRIAAGLGVEDDVRTMQRRMERVSGVLADTERRRRMHEHETAAGAWLDELRDFLYDADDVLDLCRFEEICKDRLFLSLAVDDSKAEDGGGRVRTRTSTPLLDTNVVGKEMKSATEALVETIMPDDGRGEVVTVSIAVVGMGGIGKTTLAQRVFNSRRITGGFPLRAWLCISREYSETDTVKEAIRCCGGDYGCAETLAELELILRSTISGKRFFLVLDDVWEAGVKHLSADSGWELLHRTACLDGKEIQSLRCVGMAIVTKCGFLPLTIKVIGGLLMTKRRSRSEWERVLGSDAWSMAELPDEFKGAIFLSYEDLPPLLKQCFLYFSLFPADFVYYRWHLCRQWVAEGFIAASGECTVEEIAEDYYYELITRSILQPHPSYLADQSRCTVHDVLRFFAQHLSRRESVCGDLQAVPGSSALVKLRRLSLVNLAEAMVPCNAMSDDRKCLRTLFLIGIPKS